MLTKRQLTQLRQAEPVAGKNRVGAAMKLAGLTQERLADLVGMEQASISRIVNGRYRDFPIERAYQFADTFGCGVEDLFPVRQAVAS